MKLKRLTALLLSVMLVLSLAACGGGKDTKDDSADGDLSGKEIIIGNITPVTGAQAAYGLAITNSIQLAIDEINAAGGILGRDRELSTKDDQGTPAEAVSGFNSLLSEGASAIIGATLSSCTSAITSLADDEGIVLVTPSSTADSITTKDDYVFRSCFKDSFQGEMVAAYAKDQGWTKAAVLYATGDTYSSGLHDSFVKAAEKYGIELVCEQSSSDTGAVDFSSQLATIAASGADMLFAPYYYDAVGPKIIPQAREAGFKGAIMGCDGFDGTQDYTTGDLSAYENVYFTNHYSPEDSSEIVQSYVKNYTEKYGSESMNALGALAYDAMYMVKQAIEKAGSIDHEAIRDAMSGMHYVGVTGDMTLDETGTPEKSVAILTFTPSDGKLVQKFVKDAELTRPRRYSRDRTRSKAMTFARKRRPALSRTNIPARLTCAKTERQGENMTDFLQQLIIGCASAASMRSWRSAIRWFTALSDSSTLRTATSSWSAAIRYISPCRSCCTAWGCRRGRGCLRRS